MTPRLKAKSLKEATTLSAMTLRERREEGREGGMVRNDRGMGAKEHGGKEGGRGGYERRRLTSQGRREVRLGG